jgi:hypothetical protein
MQVHLCISGKKGIRRRKRGDKSVHRWLQKSSYINLRCIYASLAERRKGMRIGQGQMHMNMFSVKLNDKGKGRKGSKSSRG